MSENILEEIVDHSKERVAALNEEMSLKIVKLECGRLKRVKIDDALAGEIPEFKGKLMKKYFDHVHVDDELTGLLRRKRRFGDSIYGLKDKNGKPIRDGEIVETKYGRICKVGFMHNDGFCGYDLTPFDKIDCKAPDDYDMWASQNLTVVSDQYPYEEE